MSELKVGDVVSECYRGVYGEIWTAKQVLKINRYFDLRDDSIIVQGGILYFKNTNWQRGIHPSLIPEGFAIVPLIPTQKMVDESIENMSNMGSFIPSRFYEAMIKAAPKPTDK